MNCITRSLSIPSLLLTAALSLPPSNQAQSVDLPSVTDPPYLGTYYSLANTNWPALPILPFDLPVYLLYTDPTNGPVYAYDDRLVDYEMMAPLTASSNGTFLGPLDANYIGGDCGCAPWLTINKTGSNAVLVTAHRLVAGQTCHIYSSTNITLPFTNWAFETNLVAAVGPATTVINMSGRSNLFFRASAGTYQATNYVVDTNALFTGLTHDDTQSDPPDTMGASGGPDATPFFLEVLNGSVGAKAVYGSAGQLLAISTNYGDILGPTIDARVLWDAHARRWVVSCIGGSYATIAVSRTDNPTDFTGSNWYTINTNLAGVGNIDWDTLGLDDNGIYFTVIRYTNSLTTYSGNTVLAIKKPNVYQGTWAITRIDFYNTIATNTVLQPALNLDPIPTNGLAWFVTKGPPQLGASYQGGAIYYSSLQWAGTNATLSTNWIAITNAGPTYRDYYDLDIPNVIAPEATALLGGQINLWPIGSRLTKAVIRNGALWTCQAVGLNGTNGAFTNAISGSNQTNNVDRTGIQWCKLTIDSTNAVLAYAAHGRAFDRVSRTNQLWFHFPSIMVNCAGDMVTGFSGCGATNYVSAFYSWRLAGGTELSKPGLIRAGTTNSYDPRWGDYSATTIDPADDHSFWTVQEVALPSTNADPGYGNWKTVISRIMANP